MSNKDDKKSSKKLKIGPKSSKKSSRIPSIEDDPKLQTEPIVNAEPELKPTVIGNIPMKCSILLEKSKNVPEENIFVCNHCYKTFKLRMGLKKHVQQVHEKNPSEKKSFLCNHCKKPFGQKTSLKRHIDCVHKKLKPFKCTMCDLAFGTQSHLKRHVSNVHLHVKSFSCNYCDKRTNTKFHMKRHLKIKHEIKSSDFSLSV